MNLKIGLLNLSVCTLLSGIKNWASVRVNVESLLKMLLQSMRSKRKNSLVICSQNEYYLRDLEFNVLLLDIDLEGWNSTQVQLSSAIASISESFSSSCSGDKYEQS